MLPLFTFSAGIVADPDRGVSEHKNEALSVDARFDKTGDGIVDAFDWSQMSKDEQRAYASESLKALGEDPNVLLLDGQSRLQHYLQGLRSVYE